MKRQPFTMRDLIIALAMWAFGAVSIEALRWLISP